MKRNIVLEEFEGPVIGEKKAPVPLSEETMQGRKDRLLQKMKEENLDTLLVYEDLEHGSNFEYLTGFLTRFEEALLVLHKDGKAFLLLGNENMKLVSHSRIKAEGIHVPFFSLPNQPMEDEKKFAEYLKEAGLQCGSRVGIVGWKMFTGHRTDPGTMFEVPYYIVEAVREITTEITNRSDLFIGGSKGIRTVNNAEEIAHYEYGAALAGNCMHHAVEQIEEGRTEMEIAGCLCADGQPHSVITIAATGKRFEKANLYPTDKKIRLQDCISLTTGYKGGLSSRAGYAVRKREELPGQTYDYIEKLAAPYFGAVVEWLESIKTGMTGGELYQKIEEVLSRENYHWSLNPGHLTADEEWMSSPIYEGSEEILKSGMLLQIDIIPSLQGYGGCGCESTVALADQKLQEEIRRKNPELFLRFMQRRGYMEKVLHIRLSEEVLLMSDTVAYYRPFFLNKKLALRGREEGRIWKMR